MAEVNWSCDRRSVIVGLGVFGLTGYPIEARAEKNAGMRTIATAYKAYTGPTQLRGTLPDGRTFPIHVRAGRAVSASTPILIVMHGATRNPIGYLNAWEPLIEGRDVLVMAPEFSLDDYPGSENYNLAGMRDADGDDVPVEQRVFCAIDVMMSVARRRLGVRARKVDLYGHSAGAQFVHRYLTFTADAPIRRAVAANAGWYTMPDSTVRYPYGLSKAPQPRAPLGQLLGTRLAVMVGELDTDPDDEDLRRTELAMAQGETRFDRAKSYFACGQQAAQTANLPFGWEFHVVPDVAHDQAGMAAAAAPLFFGGSTT